MCTAAGDIILFERHCFPVLWAVSFKSKYIYYLVLNIFAFSFYRIIVAMVDDTLKKQLNNLSEVFKEPLKSYQEWYKLEEKVGVPYVAFAFEGEKFEKYKNFIVGNDEKFENTYSRRKKRTQPEHKNGKLIPGKDYAVAVRAYTAKVR